MATDRAAGTHVLVVERDGVPTDLAADTIEVGAFGGTITISRDLRNHLAAQPHLAACISQAMLHVTDRWPVVLPRELSESECGTEGLPAQLMERVMRWVDTLEGDRFSNADVVAAFDRALANAKDALEWSVAVGERYDTARVTKALGISRQALSNRRASGSLIALEGAGTSWWPAWQFDAASSGLQVRPAVAAIVGAFRDALGDAATEFMIAAWASSPNQSLHWSSPAEWIAAGKDVGPVLDAASEDAAAEAR